ncbi:hypothetical protein HHI36_006752 [Cryptolaemus montrouzieri]|uniref:Uncharacterized protein n=1 Tax=Cryptolaemus montrouzieri TaxID=559131 RepID=A0ABD2NYH6_9CUCU
MEECLEEMDEFYENRSAYDSKEEGEIDGVVQPNAKLHIRDLCFIGKDQHTKWLKHLSRQAIETKAVDIVEDRLGATAVIKT